MNTERPWATVALEEICAPAPHAIAGGPFGSDLTRADYLESPGVPVIRGTNLGGDTGLFVDDGFVYVSDQKAVKLEKNLARPGDLVFTQRGTLGQVAVIPTAARFPRYVVSQSQMKVSIDATRADPVFVWHYFRSPKAQRLLLRQTLATGVPHINLGILKRLTLPLPPLTEQRRIAVLLDKADAIRGKRQQAIRLAGDLLRSAFLDIFGDPVTNHRRWPGSLLGHVSDIQGGLQVTAARQGRPLEVPYLRVANVYRDRLDLSEVKTLRVTDQELTRATLKSGDLLVVEGHGNPEEIGRCAVWSGLVARCVHQNHLIRVRVHSGIEPVFMSAFLNSAAGRRQMTRFGKTTSGLNTISTANVAAVRVLVPPVEVQRRYVAFAAFLANLVRRLETSQRLAEENLKALAQGAFGT